jgi:hypothetical protein
MQELVDRICTAIRESAELMEAMPLDGLNGMADILIAPDVKAEAIIAVAKLIAGRSMDDLERLLRAIDAMREYKAKMRPGEQEVYAINMVGEPGGKHYAPIDPNWEFAGQLGEIRSVDGLRVVRFSFDWHVDRAFRMFMHDGANWFQGHPNPNGGPSDEWRDRIQFQICIID